MTSVVWFKRDLRIADHLPLLEATRRGPCICLYIYEPLVLEGPSFEASHLGFLNESLKELADELEKRGGRLITRRGEAVYVFAQLHLETQFTAIYSHEETAQWSTYQRDLKVARWAKETGVAWHEFPTNGIVRRLKSRDGWSAIWEKRMSMPQLKSPSRVESVPDLKSCGLMTSETELNVAPTVKETVRQRGGTQEGLQLLESFLKGRGQNYAREISSPNSAENSCSRLSPYLTFGCLSMKQVYQTTATASKALKQSTDSEAGRYRRSLLAFEGRLHWHCHFIQKLEQRPELEFENMMRLCDGLRENEFSAERFEAWKEGRTGFPMVDACMRSVIATGWLNFRMRAMLVSFASYQLWLDWRVTSKFLGRHFLDYEPGIHYSQFQMQSGTTGNNTLRMYNPTKQATDHDPNGAFIRRWIPELAGVPVGFLAEPWRMTNGDQLRYGCVIGLHYPAPVVDLKESVSYARKRFSELRHSAGFTEEAKAIQKHLGSRKKPTQQPRKRKVSVPQAKDLQRDLFE